MTSDVTRTLLIDAAIVAALVVLAFVLAPGMAVIGIAALIVLILGAISFLIGNLRTRRRLRRREARRQAVASQSPYSSVRGAGPPGSNPHAPGRPEGPAVRRVPASRRTQTRRKPLQ
ncbi:MAG: hypothetical protein JO243_19580 [Solirubrobacterales bacterium]|nr:hypothetical protein [Solirubrobacterales bacterium]